MLRSYLWIIPLTLLWPIIHLMVFLFRFGKLPPSGLSESAVFLGMGFVSGVVLIFLMQKAKSRRWKIGTFVGYLIATPFAFLGSLVSGLLFPPLVGTLIFGALPLVIGSAIGYGAGKKADALDLMDS